jgi:hypothetical protein
MSKLFRDDNGQLCTFGKLGTSQVIAVTSTSQQSNAFAAGTTIIRIANTSTAHVHYAIGPNPTANLTTSATLPINQIEYLEVSGGDEIALISGTSSTVSVTQIV